MNIPNNVKQWPGSQKPRLFLGDALPWLLAILLLGAGILTTIYPQI